MLAWASSTILIICASAVSAPIFVAWKLKAPLRLSVPPMTAVPGFFSTGIDSPVSIDSSTLDWPSITLPSVGIFSPGRTTTASPTMMLSAEISTSFPSRST
ncbi:hypothetical protein D9M72_221330 [compost metagenome]